MKVEIADILDDAGATAVFFRCACGAAVGRWDGVPPLVGDVRYVEFDCDDELEPEVNVVRSTCDKPHLEHRAGKVEICARLLARYEEGTVLLGFDDGRLEVEAHGNDFWRVDNWYKVTLSAISLYDMKV